MDVFQGKIDRNGCNLSQMETKMGPEVQYFCWVLLSSPGVNNSLSTIFLGHPVCSHQRNEHPRVFTTFGGRLHPYLFVSLV